jgi:hypothetical protein
VWSTYDLIKFRRLTHIAQGVFVAFDAIKKLQDYVVSIPWNEPNALEKQFITASRLCSSTQMFSLPIINMGDYRGEKYCWHVYYRGDGEYRVFWSYGDSLEESRIAQWWVFCAAPGKELAAFIASSYEYCYFFT